MISKELLNKFKIARDQKVRFNTEQVERALNLLPQNIEVTLSNVVKSVAKKTGLHVTTINKNEAYFAMCNDKYLSLKKNNTAKNKKKNNTELENELNLLRLENVSLENQVKVLSNIIKGQTDCE